MTLAVAQQLAIVLAAAAPLRFELTYDAAIAESFTGRVYVLCSTAGGRGGEPRFGPRWFGTDPFECPCLLESLGDLFSTVADQIAFLRALMSGSAFRGPTTARLMNAQWHAFGFDPTTPRLPGWPIQYGLGMMRFALPRWYTPFKPVPPVVGHTGSTGCWLFYCQDIDLYSCGGVDQITAGAVPFRAVPRVLEAVS